MQIIDTQANSVQDVTIALPSGVFPLHEELDPNVDLERIKQELQRHYGNRFKVLDVTTDKPENKPEDMPATEAIASEPATPKRRRG